MAYFANPVTYGGKQPTAEALKAKMLLEPPVEQLDLKTLGFQIQEGIKSSTTDYSLSAARKVTRRDTGCGSWTPTKDLLTMGSNTINVWPLKIELEDCADRYDGTILELAKKRGHATDNDLTGTVLEEIVREALSPVVYEDMLRILFLGDRTSADPDYNQVDGLRKQLLAKATAGKVNKGAAISAAAIADDETGPAAAWPCSKASTKAVGKLKNVARAQQGVLRGREHLRHGGDGLHQLRQGYHGAGVGQNAALQRRGRDSLPRHHRQETAPVLPVRRRGPARRSVAPPGLPDHPTNIIVAMDQESDLAEIDDVVRHQGAPELHPVLYRLGTGFGFDALIVFAI